MYHIIESCDFERPRSIGQFSNWWSAVVYKFFYYDLIAEPGWKLTYSWKIVDDLDLE